MDDTTTQRRQAERRRLWDRRAPGERRSGEERRQEERRSSTASVSTDRRHGQERRAGNRRSAAEPGRRAPVSRRHRERRSSTPLPYSPEQHAELEARFAKPGPVTCPVCGARFTLGPGRREDGVLERLVVCGGCRRGTVVHDGFAARVLVVSSVAPLRGLLREMLAGAGHDVVEAADAAVGLDAYRTVPADVVIVDVVGSGRIEAPEFIRRLRRGFPEARVMALAGRSSYAGVDPLSFVEGLQDVRGLRVPVSREALLQTVRELRG